MKYTILTIATILAFNYGSVYGQGLEETKQANRIPFKGIELKKDTINKLIIISYPKDWQRDLKVESQLSPSYYYRCFKKGETTIAYFQLYIMYVDNPDVTKEAQGINRDYTGENGFVANTSIDGRKAAYCFYKQKSSVMENNFTIKHLVINADNQALVTVKTQSPDDQMNSEIKNLLEDIENSIKILKQ